VGSANQVMSMSGSFLIDPVDELAESSDLVQIVIEPLEDLSNVGANTIKLTSAATNHLSSNRLNGREWKD